MALIRIPHGTSQLREMPAIAREIGRETSETLLPMASLVGFALGVLATLESLDLTRGDLVLTVTFTSLLVCGPIAPPLAGLLIALRMSTSQATEIQMKIHQGDTAALGRDSIKTRLQWMAAAGIATCSIMQLSAAIGAILAIEWRLPGAAGLAMDLVLTTRAPLEWLGDALLSATIAVMIGASSVYAANAGARNDREISRTAGRSATLGLLAVLAPAGLYWIVRGL